MQVFSAARQPSSPAVCAVHREPGSSHCCSCPGRLSRDWAPHQPCTHSSHLPLKINPPIQQQVHIWLLARSSLTAQSWFCTLFFGCGHSVGQAPVINYFYVPNSSSMKQTNPLRILLCCVFLWCMTSVECHKLITFLITALYWIRDVLSIE